MKCNAFPGVVYVEAMLGRGIKDDEGDGCTALLALF